LTNFSGNPIDLRRIEILDEGRSTKPIASFEGENLDELLQNLGPGPPGGRNASSLPGGSTTVAFMWVAFESAARVPEHFRHRVITADQDGEGASISAHHGELKVLGPPVEGADWRASDGRVMIPTTITDAES
jgi:hypothetical protein